MSKKTEFNTKNTNSITAHVIDGKLIYETINTDVEPRKISIEDTSEIKIDAAHVDMHDAKELVKSVFRKPPRVATLEQLRIESALKSIIADMSKIFAKQRPVTDVTTVLSELRQIENCPDAQLLKLQDEIMQLSKNDDSQSYSLELGSIADALEMLNRTIP